MRKLIFVLITLMLLSLACVSQKRETQLVAPLPALPTVAPTESVVIPPQEPTAIPATATELPLPTPTELSTATPITAVAPPTSTPVPTAIPPTLTPLPTATSAGSDYATLLFEDDFSTDKGVWPQDGNNNDGISVTNIIDGQLVTNIIKPMYDINIPLDYEISWPVLIQVDAMLLDGDDTVAYGIMCNYKDVDNYYGMTISENGYIEIYRWENGTRETLSKSTNSTYIKKGKNELKAICDQDMVGIFANNELVGSYLSLKPLTGNVGLLAGTLDTSNVKVGFDNYLLTKLDYEATSALPTNSPEVTPEAELPAGVLFVDDFSSDTDLWWIGDSDISTEEITGGMLKVTMHEPHYDIGIPLYQTFSGPVQIDVDGLSLFGHKNTAYGVMCGFAESGDYFGLDVTELRHASIYRWSKGIRTPLWDLYDVAAVNREGNHLTAVCSGKVLEFYVNGQLLKTITNYSSVEGGIGLVVSSFGSDEVEIGFDNFVVTSLD